MRYNERLAGYQALLTELEIGLEPMDNREGFFRLKQYDTAPNWAYDELRLKFTLAGGIYQYITKREVGMLFAESLVDGISAESRLAEAIEWVKARIAEGPPKPRLNWVFRADYGIYSSHYFAFVPTNEDGSAGFVLQAVSNHKWKRSAESYEYIIYAAGCIKPVDIATINPGCCLLHVRLEQDPDGGYPAPFLEAEEALEILLSTALKQLIQTP